MASKIKTKRTLKNTVVYDPVTKRFIQKDHIVHGDKVLQYPEGICEYCSSKYPKHRILQRFCNKECRNSWWTMQNHDGHDPNYGEMVCVICGRTFPKTRPWSKYCCDDCQKEGIKRIMTEKRQQKVVLETV